MFTEQELINNEVTPHEDMEGVEIMIQNLFNEITKKRVRVIQLHREQKSQEALERQVTANEMSAELNDLIKDQLNYLKYLKAIGKTGDKNQQAGVSKELKNQTSSNGKIVSEIPKY